MDVIDMADVEVDNYVKDVIANNVKKVQNKKLKPVGYCHYCEDDVGLNQLFCNGKCAKLYDDAEKLKNR